jgi:putative ABC transport system permease protein
VPVTFPSGSTTLHVAAIYRGATEWVGSQFVDLAAFDANGIDDLDFRVYVAGDEAAIDTVAAAYASADVLDRDEFLESVNAEIDTVLGIFSALLGLAVLIALLGIANTLALSIFERRREIGLMRAVGMTRRQVRSTVRLESIVIALLGTSLGLAVGTFFGWAIVRAMSDQGIDTLTVPTSNLGVIAAVAAVAGAVAAAVPARRASRLDILGAITAD